MGLLTGSEISELLEGIVYRDTQEHEHRFDLTVNRISRVIGAGKLDFGGSEFQPADRNEIEPEKKNPDDDYGWWILDEGVYHVQYNESFLLREEQTALIYPLDRLQQAGAYHAAHVLNGRQETVGTLLTVGTAGCHLKENCRVSSAVVME